MNSSPLLAIFFLALSSLHAQSFEWVVTAGGAKSDKTRCINVDREGNVLLAGEITGDAKFGDIIVKSTGSAWLPMALVVYLSPVNSAPEPR